MDSKFDITVALPLYNVETYVERSLRSALDQDFKGSYEILIIDDCCTDGTMDIVSRVCVEHPKGAIVRVYKNEKNTGIGFNRNTCIREAQGKYLFYLDSDDWMTTDCLTTLYNKAQETDAEIVLGSIERIEEGTGRLVKRRVYPEKTINCEHAGIYLYEHDIPMYIETWNKLFLVSLLREHNIGFIHRIMEEYIFDFKLRCHLHRIAMIPNITYYYNIRPNSIVTSVRGKVGTDETAFIFTDIIKNLQKLAAGEYSMVPGAYDLYYRLMIWALEGLKSSSYTHEQWQYIYDNVHGYRDFIKSVSQLKNPRNRFVYRFDKEGVTLDRFYKINELANSRAMGAVFKLLKKLK